MHEVEKVEIPDGADIAVHMGSGLRSVRPGAKLPAGALAWCWVGGPRWHEPASYPYGMRSAESEAEEAAAREKRRGK